MYLTDDLGTTGVDASRERTGPPVVPSLNKTVTSVDQPTADAQFIKNVAYRQCGKPVAQWNEHADIRSEDEGEWLCEEHAGSPGRPGEQGACARMT